jgi:hypothetical protein
MAGALSGLQYVQGDRGPDGSPVCLGGGREAERAAQVAGPEGAKDAARQGQNAVRQARMLRGEAKDAARQARMARRYAQEDEVKRAGKVVPEVGVASEVGQYGK